jgi:tRNA pseudouridine38-40 synthase
MYRYFIEFQFNGKNYHGWQIQPNAPTIQAVLDEKISVLLNHTVHTVGAGRTDAGVHAKYFAAHFEFHESLETSLTKLIKKLNSFLPADIKVTRIFRVPKEAHARFSAISRTYEYYIVRGKDVFRDEYAWQLNYALDIDTMNKAAKVLQDHTDFTSFSKLHTDVKTNNCRIFSAGWSEKDQLLTFSICADRFLRNMVRAIVGTMVLLGRRKIDLTEFQKIIESKDRSVAGESAPAKALFLADISYPSGVYKFLV